MPGHNASLTLLGVFMLWFGWYGFNPGSTNAIMNGVSAISAAVAVNTTMAAAAGTISCLFIAMVHQYVSLGVIVWDLIIAGNGALAGLVAITGGWARGRVGCRRACRAGAPCNLAGWLPARCPWRCYSCPPAAACLARQQACLPAPQLPNPTHQPTSPYPRCRPLLLR